MNEITAANVRAAYELEHKHDNNVTRLEKFADSIAKFSGSVAFIGWHVVLFILWIGFNALSSMAFDPYPFTFLTLSVSLEAILLTSILLINQTKVGAQADRRHQLDLQINLLAEQENTMMLRVLDRIARKLEIDSKELQDYLEDTHPEEVVEVLEAAEKSNQQST